MSSGSLVTGDYGEGESVPPVSALPVGGTDHSTEKPLPSPTSRPWRIAFCITEPDPGGAERQLLRLATGLGRGLFEPEIVCLSGRGELIKPLRDAGVSVTCLDARGRWDAGVMLRLRRHFWQTRPDLVQ